MTEETTGQVTEGSWGARFAASVVVAVVLLSGMTAVLVLASGTAAAAAPFRSLRIGVNPLLATTLNPLKISLADEYGIVYNVYSTLDTYVKAYHVVPALASQWSLASHRRTSTL